MLISEKVRLEYSLGKVIGFKHVTEVSNNQNGSLKHLIVGGRDYFFFFNKCFYYTL